MKSDYGNINKGFNKLQNLMFTNYYRGSYEDIEEYIKNNPNELNYQDRNGLTAIMLCCKDFYSVYIRDRYLQLLLQNYANVDLKSKFGDTALMITAIHSTYDKAYEKMELLLDYGADVNAQNIYGYSALLLAVKCCNTETSLKVVKMLLDNGANVNLCDNDNYSPLMVAVQYCDSDSSIETVQLLLEYKANIDLKNNNGDTAVTMAIEFGACRAIDLLVQYDAKICLEI